MEVLTRVIAYEIKTGGTDNLRKTSELINEGKRLVIMPNHLSNADYFVITDSFRRKGFGKIANRTVPLEGLRIGMHPVTKFLAEANDAIQVWPPTIPPKNDEELKEKRRMDRESLQYAKRALENGRHLLIFPEGTRSRNGRIQEGQPGAVHFLTLTPNTFIFPIGVWNTEKILAPGSPIPALHSANVNYGEPFSVSETMKLFPKRVEFKNHIMGRIAALLPIGYQEVSALQNV